MDEATRDLLLELNRRFYSRHARSFSDSRRRPWSGWDRVLEHLPATTSDPLRVLDLGCGNGRFGSYLAERRRGSVSYHGLDSSRELLADAERRLAPIAAGGGLEARLSETDLVRDDLSEVLGAHRYHLIAVFGVLHHVPGRSSRNALVAGMGRRLEDRGVLAVSLWRFDRRPRHREKILPWSSYDGHLARPIEPAELEDGDLLLTWAGDRETPRYCHLIDDGEASGLVESSGLTLLDRFVADGKGSENTYLILGGEGFLC